ncbi:UDP-glucose 4-epimerase family protein [Trinickia sp. EG282A]|uniref:UDP-glucose 4-epimerase family protein n=1 Tax=Trinickia sp. EG282A TaxID=3237013 RepID=UPI0034D1CE4C
MSHIVVTGANGFVGRAVCRALIAAGHSVTGAVRQSSACTAGITEWVLAAPDFDGMEQAWPAALKADCIIHLAARVHVTSDTSSDPFAAFRSTNVDGTLRVARAAQANGVRRFVFASSIKAVAETDPGRPLREDDPPAPQDAYGRSKLDAEVALRRFGEQTGMEVVIVRPPLVYGPGVRANFFSLMQSIARGIPLPLGGIEARRSIVYVENLADALVRCAVDPRAAGKCFHVADDESLTVAELAYKIGDHLQKPARLLAVPPACLRFAGRLTGRLPQVERLTGNLRVDSSYIRTVLSWRPVSTLEDGLAETVRWYRSMH